MSKEKKKETEATSEKVVVNLEKALEDKLAAFEKRMELLVEKNNLLEEQIALRKEIAPKSPIEAPNVLPSYSTRLLKEMEHDSKMVKGKFELKEIMDPQEAMGSTISFCYRKYPGPVHQYTLTHNKEEEIPLGVANHINGQLGGCKYNIHGFVVDKDGNPKTDLAYSTVHRMGFSNTAFL